MRDVDQLSVAFDAARVEESGKFSGYASVFGVVDQQMDVVLSGAFSRSIAERGVENVHLLWQHDTAQPIGKITALREDAFGLFMEGSLTQGVQQGKEALALLREGAINGMSIGYNVVSASVDNDGVRLIGDVDLWEVSLVTFPANESATVSHVKGASGEICMDEEGKAPSTIREFEQWLKKNGFSRHDAKRIASQGFEKRQAESVIDALDRAIEALR